MPDIVTAYPNIVLAVLKSTNAKCGVGAEQKILIACPKEQFCSLPAGELCVHSTINFITSSSFIVSAISLFTMVLVLGIMVGVKLK